ncbi:MAG: flagellar hook-associated protein FlgK [Lachnospiraceae bacterium]|nr:flagellar hook-associated protein FlgK [Lachnospiraceae bacterium]
MPLLGSLYIGTSGLQTGQNALNTVAHNLSNIDTEGYTRQQVQQSDRAYVTISTKFHGVSNMQYGLGVSYSNVKQIRDYFLDKTYRQELGRSAFYEVSYNVMEEVEYQLGELNGEAFETDLTNLWTAVQELAKDPSNSVTQSLLVQRASEFLESSKAVYAGLSSYQDNLNAQIKQQVDKINKYGKEILELNDQIRTIESGKTEHANDLRDRRNQILDELGELCNMSYVEDMWGNVSVQIEGVDFIKGSTCYQIALDVDSSTGFYTPFWPQNAKYTITETGEKKYIIDGAEVFNLNREISSEANTDIGRLKAMVLARGDHRANYTDISNYSEIEDSVLMNIQAEFDQLIHNVVTAVNEILEDAAGVVQGDLTLNDGTTLENARYITAYDRYGYMREEDGRPLLLFVKEATDEFRRVTGADGVDYFVYEEEDFGINESLYTAENIQINALLMQSPAKLSFKLEDGSVDIKTAEALKKAFEEEKYILNPKVQTMGTFVEYYSNLVAQVANSGSVYKSIYDNQEQTVEATSNARDQVLAVSSDEELSNMIRFQNAYNASSRYINVIDEMMEHLLNTLGA